MRFLGCAIFGGALMTIGVSWFEGSVILALLGLSLIYLAIEVSTWTIKDIGDERIVIEPSPVPGFNAWFEQRSMTGWHRDLNLSGWGQTEVAAEESVRATVAEYKANLRRMENTPRKVIEL